MPKKESIRDGSRGIQEHSIRLPARLAVLAILFFMEKNLLYPLVDAANSTGSRGVGGVVHDAQHWILRFLVALLAALAAMAYVHFENPAARPRLDNLPPVRIGFAAAHFISVGTLIPLSYLLYREGDAPATMLAITFAWCLTGASAFLTAALATATRSIWIEVARSLGKIWAYAAVAALLGTVVWKWTQTFWEPTAAVTFSLVRNILFLFKTSIIDDPATRIIGTDRFRVYIADYCSGLEGVGLMLAFSTIWLLYFRREYLLPRSLILVPVSAAMIFALNAMRIALLIIIGDAGYADVASYGFHSQAGWIAFNTVACALVFISRRIPWLMRDTRETPVANMRNPTALYVVPLLSMLTAGTVSHAMSGQFEDLYPLRALVVGGTLIFFRKELLSLDWRPTWRGPAVGAIVFLLWIGGANFIIPAKLMPAQLASYSPIVRATWITSRVFVSTLLVPFVEELGYRGYLMRRINNANFEAVGYRAVRLPALSVSSAAFGIAHGSMWFPGIIAGFAYGILAVRRGSLGEAVAAHATANALVALTVLLEGQWQLW